MKNKEKPDICPICRKLEVQKLCFNQFYFACPNEDADDRHKHYYKTGEVLPPPPPDPYIYIGDT